jgi:hypothetical protein
VSRARKLVWGGGLAVALATAGVYAGVTLRGTPSSMTTLMSGWEQRFTLEWTVESEPGRSPRLRGYITSQHGEHAEPVRLLVQAFDANGTVVERRIWAIPGGVNVPAAHAYRVFVWDYTYRQS